MTGCTLTHTGTSPTMAAGRQSHPSAGDGMGRSVRGLLLAGAVALGACGPSPASPTGAPASASAPAPPPSAPAALIHFANRSDVAITIGPGLTIPACGGASATRVAFDAARFQAGRMALDGQKWDAPAGALVWDMAFANELKSDVTLVITSMAPVAARVGLVAEADLPECGGAPQGIYPGLPQGVELTVTPLP
jgi:hypothetical protein